MTEFTHAVRSYYADGATVRTPAASREEALAEARRLVDQYARRVPDTFARPDCQLVQVNVIEWRLAEECVWHADWTDAEKRAGLAPGAAPARVFNPEDVI